MSSNGHTLSLRDVLSIYGPQVLLEGLLNPPPRRTGGSAGEATGVDVSSHCCRENVGRQRCQFLSTLDDDNVRHISPSAPERLAFIAFVENLRQPALGQQRFNEGRQLARRGFAHESRSRSTPRFPAPFESIVGQPTERFPVPGDEKIERRLVDRRLGNARL